MHSLAKLLQKWRRKWPSPEQSRTVAEGRTIRLRPPQAAAIGRSSSPALLGATQSNGAMPARSKSALKLPWPREIIKDILTDPLGVLAIFAAIGTAIRGAFQGQETESSAVAVPRSRSVGESSKVVAANTLNTRARKLTMNDNKSREAEALALGTPVPVGGMTIIEGRPHASPRQMAAAFAAARRLLRRGDVRTPQRLKMSPAPARTKAATKGRDVALRSNPLLRPSPSLSLSLSPKIPKTPVMTRSRSNDRLPVGPVPCPSQALACVRLSPIQSPRRSSQLKPSRQSSILAARRDWDGHVRRYKAGGSHSGARPFWAGGSGPGGPNSARMRSISSFGPMAKSPSGSFTEVRKPPSSLPTPAGLTALTPTVGSFALHLKPTASGSPISSTRTCRNRLADRGAAAPDHRRLWRDAASPTSTVSARKRPRRGKTIMAGLLIKELLIRGDLERCLIVAPGSLVEQWQEELSEKFGLPFDILTRDQIEASHNRQSVHRTSPPYRASRRGGKVGRTEGQVRGVARLGPHHLRRSASHGGLVFWRRGQGDAPLQAG